VSSIELGKVTISLNVAERLAKPFDLTLSQLIKMAEEYQKTKQKKSKLLYVSFFFSLLNTTYYL